MNSTILMINLVLEQYLLFCFMEIVKLSCKNSILPLCLHYIQIKEAKTRE